MKLKLTNEQIKLIENRLEENLKEDEELRVKDRKKGAVNGWDFVALSNERSDLEDIIKKGYVEL